MKFPIKKKKMMEIVKFCGTLLVALSVIVSLFAPFILSYSQK